jgi:hypothetical protein
MTKYDVAEVLRRGRTVENQVQQQDLPASVAIANRGVWHLQLFYARLDQRLRMTPTEPGVEPVAKPKGKGLQVNRLQLGAAFQTAAACRAWRRIANQTLRCNRDMWLTLEFAACRFPPAVCHRIYTIDSIASIKAQPRKIIRDARPLSPATKR